MLCSWSSGSLFLGIQAVLLSAYYYYCIINCFFFCFYLHGWKRSRKALLSWSCVSLCCTGAPPKASSSCTERIAAAPTSSFGCKENRSNIEKKSRKVNLLNFYYVLESIRCRTSSKFRAKNCWFCHFLSTVKYYAYVYMCVNSVRQNNAWSDIFEWSNRHESTCGKREGTGGTVRGKRIWDKG